MKKTYLFILLGILTVLNLKAQVNEYLPAFPQAEGFGAYSLGGCGGKVIFVNNLNDDRQFTFLYESHQSQQLCIRVYNCVGLRVLDMNDFSLQSGANEILIPMAGVQPGIYFLEYLPSGGNPGNIRIIRK